MVTRYIAPALLLSLTGLVPIPARGAPPQVQFLASPAGEIGLQARGATLAETLQQFAAKAGIGLVIKDGAAQQRTNLTVSAAPVEVVLHELLRGRNYALIYDAETAALDRVIVFPPANVNKSRGRAPVRARAPKKGQKPPGALVIRH